MIINRKFIFGVIVMFSSARTETKQAAPKRPHGDYGAGDHPKQPPASYQDKRQSKVQLLEQYLADDPKYQGGVFCIGDCE